MALLPWLALLLNLSWAEERFSEVRRLSGRQYAQEHNINHRLDRDVTETRPFLWDPQRKVLQTTSKVTEGDPENLKEDVSRRRNDIDNIWWPWASYEDWLTNNEKTFPIKSKNSQVLERKGRVQKGGRKRRKKFGKRRRMKSRQNGATGSGNSPEYRHGRNKAIKFYGRRQQYKPNSVISPKFVDMHEGNHYYRPNSNPTKITPTLTFFISEPTTSNNIKQPRTEIIKLKDSEEDNEIKKFYHTMPYWKDSMFKTAVQNYTRDVNECLHNNGGCEGLCINTPGSYRCHCPTGFRLDLSKKRCLDVNECLSRNGHGPCEGECSNTWGSYLCGCMTVPGTVAVGNSCLPQDTCASLSCSHTCVSTRAGPFCTCPLGMSLSDDWTTCNDVDECNDTDLHACLPPLKCRNTIGSYICSNLPSEFE